MGDAYSSQIKTLSIIKKERIAIATLSFFNLHYLLFVFLLKKPFLTTIFFY